MQLQYDFRLEMNDFWFYSLLEPVKMQHKL